MPKIPRQKEGEMLWEEQVPLMQQGVHRELARKAYALAGKGLKVFPPRENVFDALRIARLDTLKVVIIGQDPYFNEHPGLGPEAHGLCFSVRKGIPEPPSLRNILKEINDSLYEGKPVSVDTDLTRLARQGVLLLNASLTVVAKQPNSHATLGWHELTDDIIRTISEKRDSIVFMLWGTFAQKKRQFIDSNRHLILSTSHPSPLSAHKGFLGSKVFVRCNQYLLSHDISPIEW